MQPNRFQFLFPDNRTSTGVSLCWCLETLCPGPGNKLVVSIITANWHTTFILIHLNSDVKTAANYLNINYVISVIYIINTPPITWGNFIVSPKLYYDVEWIGVPKSTVEYKPVWRSRMAAIYIIAHLLAAHHAATGLECGGWLVADDDCATATEFGWMIGNNRSWRWSICGRLVDDYIISCCAEQDETKQVSYQNTTLD